MQCTVEFLHYVIQGVLKLFALKLVLTLLLNFTTLVNILLKLRFFEGRNDIQIGYKSCSVLLFSQKTYES